MNQPIFFFMFLVTLNSAASSSSSTLSCNKESVGFSTSLPYPFGFNENSGIQLNCSVEGDIKIGEFVVKNLTSNHILIDVPTNCDDGSLDRLKNLNGKNVGVSSRNILVLHGCQSPAAKCLILGNQHGLESCNGIRLNTSCYIDDQRSEFLDFDKVGNNCSTWLSSIVVEAVNDDHGQSSVPVVALDFNRVELVWWLVGNCSCDSNADCFIVNGTVEGYRCQCKSGFSGDGFTAGVGCHRGGKKDSKRKWILILPGFSIVIFVIALVVIWRKFKKWKRHHVVEMNHFNFDTKRRISYYDLLRAIEDYSLSNLLGTGGFGSVYKGVLDDGRIVGVKVFNLDVQEGIRSFDVECEVLRSLRHRNLTKVITCCSNDKDFKALILEYMPYGSLDKWLHSENYFLDMLQRLNIMVDVTYALEYLHYGFSSIIVHCDIKPSNILLDANMTARLCDFGLTRFLNEETSLLIPTL